MIKIVSGGQTGVDRAALDVALELGVPCGGWCPEGRLAEDGPLPDRYPLKSLAGGGYRERTRANVAASDATLIVYFGEVEGGTAATLRDCLELGRPCKLVDAVEIPPRRGARAVARFVCRHRVEILNVAGPRASKSPRAYAYTRALLLTWLQRMP